MIGLWNMGVVMLMKEMFYNVIVFISSIDDWDIFNVVDMIDMFVFVLMFNFVFVLWSMMNL